MKLTTNDVTGIKNMSEDILGIFNKAILKADALQSKINMARAKRIEIISEKQAEISELEEVERRNAKFSEKLKDFLS